MKKDVKSHQEESSAGLYKIHQGYYKSFLEYSAWLIVAQKMVHSR